MSPRTHTVIIAHDGIKTRPLLILGSHVRSSETRLTALEIRSQKAKGIPVPPGWVKIDRNEGGLTEPSAIALALVTVHADKIRDQLDQPIPLDVMAQVTDNVRIVLGLDPHRNPRGPRFLQYLPPPPGRAGLGPQNLFGRLKASGWTPFRRGVLYRNHGWHPIFNQTDRMFLVVSERDFNDRFPYPLAWIVPVVCGGTPPHRPHVQIALRPGPDHPPAPLYADPTLITSMEVSEQWFERCLECQYAYRDNQQWQIPLVPESTGGFRRNCVRCDDVAAAWPVPVGHATESSLTELRSGSARYLGVGP